MDASFQIWMKTLGSLMVGFFVLNFWSKWLRRQPGAPEFAFAVLPVVLVSFLGIGLYGGLQHWGLSKATKGVSSAQYKVLVDQTQASVKTSLMIGFGILAVAFLIFIVSSILARRGGHRGRKRPSTQTTTSTLR